MPELDLVFCCDCTGSMGQYIQSAQDNIRTIATQIRERASAATSVRFALVMYRDHPPQDTSYVTRVCPFVEDVLAMKAYVDQMAASGGGDGPEAVSAALAEVDKMPWRPNATKVCVFIADAPPHGLGESGDGFPEGCPMGTDPVVTCKSLATKGVIVYSVGVEPCLSLNYRYARDFMMMVAQVTEGRYLPLGRAEILTEVIVSGALEGISLDALWAKVEAEVQEANKGRDIAQTEFLAMVSEGVKEGAKAEYTPQLHVDNPYVNDQYNMHNCLAFAKEESLASARKKLDPNVNAQVQQQVQQYQWAQQPAMMPQSAQMTEEQSSRCAMRGMKAKGYF